MIDWGVIMGRKTVKKNPLRGERVKEVIKDSGMLQCDFAKNVLHCDKNTLSYKVNGDRNVTESDIELICSWAKSERKDIRKEWLLCLDDFKTTSEWFAAVANRNWNTDGAVEDLIKLHGYTISEYTDPRILTDEDGREYQQLLIALTAPSGSIRYFRPEEFTEFKNNINNIVEGLLLLEFKPRFGDPTKEYSKQK